MEATHLIKEKLIDGTAKRVAIKDVLIRQSDLADMLEEYHQAKLKLLGIANVVKPKGTLPVSPLDISQDEWIENCERIFGGNPNKG